MTDPTGTDRARRGPRLSERGERWISALEERGYRHKSALDYGATLRHAEEALAARGTDLEHAGFDDIAAISGRFPLTRSSRGRLRRALAAGARVVGRSDLPDHAVVMPAGSPPPLERVNGRPLRATLSGADRQRREEWARRLQPVAPSPSVARRWATLVVRAERSLAARGASLAAASAADLEAISDQLPDSYSTRCALRQALAAAADVAELPNLAPAAVPLPEPGPGAAKRRLSRQEAERLEEAAWTIGGPAGLAALLALHTPLRAAEIAQLRWEQLSEADSGTLRLSARAGNLPLAPHLAAALRARARTRGWMLPAVDGPIPRGRVLAYLREVAGYAGLRVSAEMVRLSQPGQVNPDLLDLVGELGGESVDPARSGLRVEDFLAQGLASRTAYTYLRVADRAAGLLAERGADLATCTPADLAALAQRFPGRSSRVQLRGALARAWEALGRQDPPPLRAVRLPPQPRRRSMALDHDHAARLEAAAWARIEDRDRAGLAVLFGLYSGLRRVEIARARWDRLDLDANGRPAWLYVHGKGDLEAHVPVHPVLADALVRYGLRPEGWIFAGRSGGHVNPTTIWGWVRDVSVGAGLDPVRTHQLRHTLITEANDATGELRTVQEIARHSRPETTAGYTRVHRSKMAAVIAQVSYGRNPADTAPPDPASSLPGISYRQLVELLEGPKSVAAWVELGQVLDDAGWQLLPEPGPVLSWAHPGRPELRANAWQHCSDPTQRRYELQLIDFDADTSEAWDFTTPAQLLAAADALAAGVAIPPGIKLGPWIEAPFVAYLAGKDPRSVIAVPPTPLRLLTPS